MTTHLRRHFAPTEDVGIEPEVTQHIALPNPSVWKAMQDNIIESFDTCAPAECPGKTPPSTGDE